MKGSAPNSPATGSQFSVVQKLQPIFAMERTDSRYNWKPMPATISTSRSPKAPVNAHNDQSSRRDILCVLTAERAEIAEKKRRFDWLCAFCGLGGEPPLTLTPDP